MKINKIIALPLAVTIFALGGIGQASAQATSPRVALQFATNGLTNTLVASSTDSTIARLMLDTTGSTESIRISSLPFNLIVGGGGNASTLTNCKVWNESSGATTSLNTTSTTLSSGVNTISFNPSIVLTPNTTTTLALRCDIASNLVAGSNYTVNMNTGLVSATGVNTGLQALVSVKGAAVIPPTTPTTPTTPGIPATGAPNEIVLNIMLLAASLSLATLGFSQIYLRKKSGEENSDASA